MEDKLGLLRFRPDPVHQPTLRGSWQGEEVSEEAEKGNDKLTSRKKMSQNWPATPITVNA